MQHIELMSPAGSYSSLMAAIKAGADSIYFGVGKLNMRARSAKNFTLQDLPEITRICAEHNVKSYLALNSILYNDEMDDMRDLCTAAHDAHVSAVIVSDVSAIQAVRDAGLPVHMSTQANISNTSAVRFYAGFADVMVLARELSVEQVKAIAQDIKEQDIRGPGGELVRIELFVHGALCVSVSGKCYMSLANTGHSANRGDCLQTCRRSYKVTDDVTGEELVIDNRYVMSPKDLCTIRYMDVLMASGATIFKIEGRGRPEDYVFKVTRAYKAAIKAVNDGTFNREQATAWEQELESVFNRKFWHGGYYMGKHWDDWSASYGSQASKQKVFLGIVKNYFSKAGVAEFTLETGEVEPGDTLMITGATTGYVEFKASEVYVNDKPAERAVKGDTPTVPVAEKVRRNDKLYKIIDRVDFQK